MNWEAIITALQAHFEVTEILLPTGQAVQCIRQESVLIPIAKVTVYGMGKSLVTTEELVELEHLKRERRTNQRAFRQSGKLDRLHELQRKQDNQRKSLENLYDNYSLSFPKSMMIMELEGRERTIGRG